MDSDDDTDILNVMDNLDEAVQKSSSSSTVTNRNSTNECADSKLTAVPPAAHLECLRSRFGHSNFRPTQWQVINSILHDRRDNCVIMATGYGKSLCFQYPSVFANGITIVISPLISLMEDQVLALTVANIPACLLGTAQSNRNIEDEIVDGNYRLVYMSPEYAIGDNDGCRNLFPRLAATGRITLLAIDEAHCVSQWGHDFRTTFRRLSEIRQYLPADVPILAVTATATIQVRDDICRSLNLIRPQVLCTGFDRSNLEFIVRKKSKSIWSDLSPFVTSGAHIGSIIIYVLTRKSSESIADILRQHGVVCEAYHAGMPLKKRKDVHERFVRDKLQIIVATIAFGMGIDKPDVRFVIHYGASKDIESYYQEVGRAGRDGQPAKCVMFHNARDFHMHDEMRSKSFACPVVKQNMERLSQLMRNFVNSSECRRLLILKYFEGAAATAGPTRADCCDNCRINAVSATVQFENVDDEGRYDYTNEVELFLRVGELFSNSFVLSKAVSIIRGSNQRNLSQFHGHRLHGAGKHISEDYWRALSELLVVETFLSHVSMKVCGGAYSFDALALTAKAHGWLRNEKRSLLMRPPNQMIKFLRRKSVVPLYDVNGGGEADKDRASFPDIGHGSTANNLAHQLQMCRFNLAAKFDVMPYMVASNLALEQLERLQPLTLNELAAGKLDGFSEVKINKFGPDLLRCIMEHKKLLPASTAFVLTGRNTMAHHLEAHPIAGVRITSCHQRILDLLHARKTVSEMADSLGIQESTVMSYLALLIKNGQHISRADLKRAANIDDELFDQIDAVLPKTYESLMTATLTPLKQMLPDNENISYEHLKLVLAYRQVRSHLTQIGVEFDDPDEMPPLPTAIECAVDAWADDDFGNEEDIGDIDEALADSNMQTINGKLVDPYDDADEAMSERIIPRRNPHEELAAGIDKDDDLFSQIDLDGEIQMKAVKEKENKNCAVAASSTINLLADVRTISQAHGKPMNASKLPEWLKSTDGGEGSKTVSKVSRKRKPIF